jgi:hypothetical protein
MAIFQSLANALKVLVAGDRVKVTLRPETGAFPNPMDGRIAEKDEAGNLSLKSERGVVSIRAEDIISITKMPG